MTLDAVLASWRKRRATRRVGGKLAATDAYAASRFAKVGSGL